MPHIHLGWNSSFNFKSNICSSLTEDLLSDYKTVLLPCETEDKVVLYLHYKETFSPCFLQQFYLGQIGLFCAKKKNLFLFQAKKYESAIHIIHVFNSLIILDIALED